MIKLGQRLHDKRIQKGLSLDDVTEATKIRPAFLKAIEHGEYHKLPESAYAQGFIANYADYLGFSKRETLALFRREFDESKVYSVIPQRFAEPYDKSFSRFKIQHSTLIVIMIFLVFISYLGYAYKGIIVDPSLNVNSLEDAKSGTVTITGKANPYDSITINKQPTFVNGDGSFTKTISVYPGRTEVVIKAVNRFGREKVIEKVINVK